MTSRREPRVIHGQVGMTLVELVIASAVTMMILVGVAALFANGLRAQANAVEGDTATGRAQVVTMSLEQSLRNARKVTVSSDGNRVVAEVLDGGTWSCRAWEVKVAPDPLKNTLEYTVGGTTTVLATGVQGSPTGVFGPTGSVEFGGRVTYDLRITINESHAVSTGAILLQATGTGGTTC